MEGEPHTPAVLCNCRAAEPDAPTPDASSSRKPAPKPTLDWSYTRGVLAALAVGCGLGAVGHALTMAASAPWSRARVHQTPSSEGNPPREPEASPDAQVFAPTPVWVRLVTSPEGAQVFRGGVLVGEGPLDVRFDSEHAAPESIVVRSPGYTTSTLVLHPHDAPRRDIILGAVPAPERRIWQERRRVKAPRPAGMEIAD